MSRKPQNEPDAVQPFAEGFAELRAALERLYIKGNLSGRLNFRVKFPYAASIVFGADLLGYDADGTDDRKRRALLEKKADVKRVELLEHLAEIEKKSVDNNTLQLDYVRGVLERYGRDFTLYVYRQDIIDGFVSGQTQPEGLQNFKPQLAAVELVEFPREGITYRELLESLAAEEERVPLSLIFNERAYLR